MSFKLKTFILFAKYVQTRSFLEYVLTQHLNLHIVRVGQDIRYALDDSKLRALGWSPKKIFDQELPKIVEYYKNNFIW